MNIQDVPNGFLGVVQEVVAEQAAHAFDPETVVHFGVAELIKQGNDP